MSKYIPIYILIGLSVFFFAAAIIMNIKSRKNVLVKEKPDFIETAVQKKIISLSKMAGNFRIKTYVMFLILSTVFTGTLSYLLTVNLSISLIFALLGLCIPELLLRITTKKQLHLYDERYARALRTMASCLRSNMTIQQAVDEICKNIFIHESIRVGFRQISSDLRVGLSVKEAFDRYARNTNSIDARDVTSAIAMQNEVGGNEAFVISAISQNITDRIMLRKEIKTLFADTSVMILVMDIMPLLILLGLYFAAPQYIMPYFENIGMTFLFSGLILVTFIGSIIIRKMTRSAKDGA